MTQAIKLAIALVAVGTFANTLAHYAVPQGPSWWRGELIALVLVFGAAGCVALLAWAAQ